QTSTHQLFQGEDRARLRPATSAVRRGYATIEDDYLYPGRFAGGDRDIDFLLVALLRSRDGAFPAQATSIAPSGSKSRRTHEIHKPFPGQSASSAERAAARRRSGKCRAGGVVSFLLV